MCVLGNAAVKKILNGQKKAKEHWTSDSLCRLYSPESQMQARTEFCSDPGDHARVVDIQVAPLPQYTARWYYELTMTLAERLQRQISSNSAQASYSEP